ncbi:uncharacterized protein BDW43DRAFT_139535 [Aspergillus alliaceus]|uniref:uncharacterized protein n=1 Tax=Petromyces alliaceus TaxID=209559 RepID=UPI0012A61E9D|nr:uncharacterized protein BDW43DRAFT_139535 [Aspergillus alliaceus]KAB8231500.1 hypothetical protein BDW43DRAFT_139535 [Aspergillus alliaceus]
MTHWIFYLRYIDDHNWRSYDMDKRWCSGLLIIYDTLSLCYFLVFLSVNISVYGSSPIFVSYIMFALGGAHGLDCSRRVLIFKQ